MPQYNEYAEANAEDIGGSDLILWEVGGVTFKMTKDQLKLLTAMVEIEDVAGTTYTLLAADQGKIKRASNASTKTITVPVTSGFLLNTPIVIRNHGAGDLTLSASGSTLNGTATTLSQYQSAVLIPVSTNVWDLYIGGATSSGGLTQLSTPGNFMAVADSDTEITCSWDDVSNEDSYTVEMADDVDFTVNLVTVPKAAGSTSHQFTTLDPSTQYFFRLKAVGDGVTYSDSEYATDDETTDAAGLIALNTPTGFSATVDGSDIDLLWTDTNSSPNEVGYEIRRNTSNTTVGATLINTTAANATAYTDPAPGTGTWYYFVRAKGNGTTTGDSSNASDSATISAGMDSDAQAYITAEETAASIDIDTTNETAISDLYTAFKAAGIYTDTLQLALGYGTGLVNGKTPGTKNLTTINSPTIGAAGYTFDGTNDLLNTTIVEATDYPAKESATMIIHIKSPTGLCVLGASDGGSLTYFFPVGGSVAMQQPSDFTLSGTGAGIYVITVRNDGVNMIRRVTKNGTQVYNVSNPVSTDLRVATYPLHIGCYNNQNTKANFYGGIVGFCAIIKRGLSDVEMTAAYNAVNAFITATSRT